MPEIANRKATLLRHDFDGIVSLRLNRPDYNLLSIELLENLCRELENIALDKKIRVVVIESSGKAFCAGHDLAEMRKNSSKEYIKNLFEMCSRMMIKITKIPQPVIAKVHGAAVAAGCQLVAQCDLAVASDKAEFGTSGINIGLFCSTPMVAVTRNLSRKHAMELLLTGELISASDAVRIGLINHAVTSSNLDEAVKDLALRIAKKSPFAIGLGKNLFYKQIEEGIEAAYKRASDAITCNMMDEETKLGIDAFLAKKPLPQWKAK